MLKIERNRFSRGLHWTTVASEKLLLALIGGAALYASLNYVYDMFLSRQVELADLFMLFIYVEIIGMVGAFYSTSRIPVTLPIIIAITALCRLIVMQSKEMEDVDEEDEDLLSPIGGDGCGQSRCVGGRRPGTCRRGRHPGV